MYIHLNSQYVRDNITALKQFVLLAYALAARRRVLNISIFHYTMDTVIQANYM